MDIRQQLKHPILVDVGDVSFEDSDYIELPSSPDVSLTVRGKSRVYCCDPGASTLKVGINIRGDNNYVFIGRNVRLNGTSITIRGNGCYLFIGNHVKANRLSVGLKGTQSLVILGSSVTWESGNCICDDDQFLVIGEDSMISNSVIIRTSDGHGIFDLSDQTLLNKPKPVLIHSHVWLGNGARVNKGTEIKSNTVLGGMSVASGILAANSLYAGIPARQLRRNISWSRTTSFDDIPKKFLVDHPLLTQTHQPERPSFFERLLNSLNGVRSSSPDG